MSNHICLARSALLPIQFVLHVLYLQITVEQSSTTMLFSTRYQFYIYIVMRFHVFRFSVLSISHLVVTKLGALTTCTTHTKQTGEFLNLPCPPTECSCLSHLQLHGFHHATWRKDCILNFITSVSKHFLGSLRNKLA